jgi:hypothetical protein
MPRLISLRAAVAVTPAVGLGTYVLGAHSGTVATAQAPIRRKVQTGWPPTSIAHDAAKLLGAEMYSKLRIAPVLLAGGDVVPTLERGAIDSVESVNCYDDKLLGLYKVAKFHYAPGMPE